MQKSAVTIIDIIKNATFPPVPGKKGTFKQIKIIIAIAVNTDTVVRGAKAPIIIPSIAIIKLTATIILFLDKNLINLSSIFSPYL
ncbi:hypothetical protein A2331_06815 [Candidatus Falkowbacteria bacterium RIFOXYB2_FULL_34_18]|uniref:Uncharacterized protein n=1 Tax=Candidatus Falkowbacteria bacterium RIFOXYD2_FULL_34_120 TaxID=1798007 RepID=A0A1F5TRF9_9BACT|nr:MAG: hypothetical protein A2331_06815 [Candidatus Falkowbacteria bacterium RIFOXYB2_FULL_34_18]OGF29968.1 MAG: hypothetical protein A2500_03865 [Candidatus Falkowbacteria bacterium RIFOXYC12_FULL_34_55]OGF37175.1 MAG: hypothetical protein A2466_02655 [Candidatus Falkowbacteria bacterium RIFOXYC2_FULL_34_220]OGF39504.1 MAG: hypothetical protein A2515_04230 [Candidatus Falkowbacteria bacterium RIFOXYD12_FULL_34_57]OGF41513.1 MAG: hypothetical protein A2531_02370 [Candidatus Falkowbacteria bact